MSISRQKLLYEYLLENTCEGHTANMKDILDYYATVDDAVEVRTVYRDIHALNTREDIAINYDGRTRGYWLERKDYTSNELRLIVDSIQSSKFITQKTADSLTKKVLKKTDCYTRSKLNRQAFVAERVRSMNESVVRESDKLYDCIASDWQVCFRFYHYTWDKKKQYSNKGKPITVSPFAILWSGGYYYLYAYTEKGTFLHYRVDRMENIRAIPQPRQGKREYNEKELLARPIKMFNMFGGPEHRVRFRCQNRMADVVFDRFGKDTILIPDDKDHFTFTTSVEVSDQFYGWVAGLGRSIRITYPPEIVNQMRAFVGKVAEMYKDEAEK